MIKDVTPEQSEDDRLNDEIRKEACGIFIKEHAGAILSVKEDEKTLPKQKIQRNLLYNTIVTFHTDGGIEFKLKAIIDTGCSTCVANVRKIPHAAMVESPYKIRISGVNSKHNSNKKVNNGYLEIGGAKFCIPLIYCFEMSIGDDGIKMLIGCNFIRSIRGWVCFEGNDVTFYKNITQVNTSQEVEVAKASIPELRLNYEELNEIQNFVLFNIRHKFKVSKQVCTTP